jgi:hypothetical protein
MWTLTVDQEGSRRVGDRVDALLAGLAAASPLVGAAPGAVVLPFERTVGDEVQGVLADADLVVALTLHLVRTGGWSIGIGAGVVDTPLPASSRAGSGSAFIHAREAVEAAKSRLRSVPLADPSTSTELVVGEYGRLRDAVAAPDGSLWVLTNNTDGRGEPGPDDDRLLAFGEHP